MQIWLCSFYLLTLILIIFTWVCNCTQLLIKYIINFRRARIYQPLMFLTASLLLGTMNADQCHLTPVFHVLKYPGCIPKPIPFFACTGKCTSYVQVRCNMHFFICLYHYITTCYLVCLMPLMFSSEYFIKTHF